jgi:hypothetical protein
VRNSVLKCVPSTALLLSGNTVLHLVCIEDVIHWNPKEPSNLILVRVGQADGRT